MAVAGACTVGAATAASADAPRHGSGVKAPQFIDAFHRTGQGGYVGEFVDQLAAQPVQLHRLPPLGGRREQHRQGVTGFVGHHQDATP